LPDLTGILTLVHILFAASWAGGAALLSIYGFRLMEADAAE